MNQSEILTVGIVQHGCADNREQNLERALAGVDQAAARGANLVLLQELHNLPYFCVSPDPDRFDLAEPVPGPTTLALGEIARQKEICIVGSVFERRTAGIYHNTAVVLGQDGTLCGTYRKMHIPDDPGYHEKFFFTPGDQGFEPIDTSLGRLGVLVCWDQWYPEAARLMALAGAELLLFPSAIGWDPSDDAAEQKRQLESWITIQRGHAIANGIPVICCNRVGPESIISFWGSSFACGPQGELLWVGAADADEVGVVNIDRRRSERVRRAWPFLRDRRIECYADICRRFKE